MQTPELGNLFLTSTARTFSISPENRQGERGKGGMAASAAGVGRKGSPCINLAPGSTNRIAAVEGSGIIQHIWFTTREKAPDGSYDTWPLRNVILRMFWDDEDTPSVECPIGDFFLAGHGQGKYVAALPLMTLPKTGFNCYFPLPFRKAARIEIENTTAVDLPLYYEVTWSQVDSLPAEAAYFHAQFRRSNPLRFGQDHIIVDGIKGTGQYVGAYIAFVATSRGWWGEGEVKFFLDGDTEFPTICGTGLEDYVCGSYCFGPDDKGNPHAYTTPYLGYVFYPDSAAVAPHCGQAPGRHGMYRFHIPDPIRFKSDFKATVQSLGWDGRKMYERDDDISSVAYWYQTEPHAPFPALPGEEGRKPR